MKGPVTYRILVIEDDHATRSLLQKTLTPEGYECLSAPNAAAGLRLAGESRPDLVLMDVHLPDGNGIELCAQLRSQPSLRHIPVLILTGQASDLEEKAQGLEAGAEDYILKPFSPKELLSRIRRVLQAGNRPSHS